MITFRPSAKFDKQAAVVFIDDEEIRQKKINISHPELKKEILLLAASGKFDATTGEVFPFIFKKQVVLLVGMGKEQKASATSLSIAARKAILSPFLSKIRDVEFIPHQTSERVVRAFIEGIALGAYSWKKYITKEKSSAAVDDKNVWIAVAPKKSFEDAVKICQGVNFARDLVNDNADTVNSVLLESVIRETVRGKGNVSLEILNRRELEKRGLNLLLAVNKASRYEPKLIIVRYQGAVRDEGYTAILGKGITFDTGGLNLKPTGSMETMRTDMSGAAAVIGTLKNVLALGVKKNLIFAVAVAENAIGSGAYKPGDVVRSYSGKTVEIANTDAEGRLVLADAISYLVKNYKPARLIDIATLTGACVVALGYDYTGLLSDDEDLARQLLSAAHETDDRAWRLPIYPELKEHVKSQVADIKNTGLRGAAGTCSGAEFLRQFATGTKWAHLDIAGTSYVQEKGRMYFGHGATGAGVRLLTEYLQKD